MVDVRPTLTVLAKLERDRRSKIDNLRQRELFTPTPKQSQFIGACQSGNFSEAYFMGANRSGKSAVGAYIGSHFARFGCPKKPPPTVGWVISLDYPISRDVIEPRYYKNGYGDPSIQPFIPDHEIYKRPTQMDKTLILKNGSIISFKSCDAGAIKFQGAGMDWIHTDEVIPKVIDDEISIRVRAGGSLFKFGTCTLLPPEGKSGDVHWLYNEVVKPTLAGSRHKTWITQASIYDNPHILEEETHRLEERYPEGSLARRIRLNGELLPGIAGSIVYLSFDINRHVRSIQEISRHYPICWSWDFNIEPMACVIGQKIGGEFLIFDEIWLEEGSINEACETFLSRYAGDCKSNIVYIYGDATGKARSHQSRMSSYQIIMNFLSEAGISYKMCVPESNPSQVDRINSVNQSLSGSEGKSQVVIDPRCKELISDLETVVFGEGNDIKKSTRRGDPYRFRTHVSDAFGYWVSFSSPVRAYGGRSQFKMMNPSYGKSKAW